MQIKWKTKNNNLNPSIILDKIESIKLVSDNGEVSFSAGIEIETGTSALETMIDFPREMDGIDKNHLIFQSISIIENLTKEIVISKINELVKQQNKTRESIFHILTSISLSKRQAPRRIEIEDNCTIELLDGNFPEKYIADRNLTINDMDFHLKDATNDYSKLIISVKAKSASGAVTKALRCIDLQRAVWCLLSNSTMELIGDEWKPINKIRLGEVHTVHNENGSSASEGFWSDPTFIKAPLFNPDNKETFENNSEWILIQITKSKYSEKLKDALLRYVRALDEKDQNNALLKLWGAIESLTAQSVGNADAVTRRCSFLFADHDYHKQVLEHLREYRNRSVHAGDQSEATKTKCFQLQYYFTHLIRFHLKDAGVFPNLDKANEFLDLPPNREELLRKKELIELALSFKI